MNVLFYGILIGEMLVAIVIDVAMHNKMKHKRSVKQWGLIVALACIVVVASFAAFGQSESDKRMTGETYIAYRYLQDGDFNLLGMYLSTAQIDPIHEAIIDVLVHYELGRFSVCRHPFESNIKSSG